MKLDWRPGSFIQSHQPAGLHICSGVTAFCYKKFSFISHSWYLSPWQFGKAFHSWVRLSSVAGDCWFPRASSARRVDNILVTCCIGYFGEAEGARRYSFLNLLHFLKNEVWWSYLQNNSQLPIQINLDETQFTLLWMWWEMSVVNMKNITACQDSAFFMQHFLPGLLFWMRMLDLHVVDLLHFQHLIHSREKVILVANLYWIWVVQSWFNFLFLSYVQETLVFCICYDAAKYNSIDETKWG